MNYLHASNSIYIPIQISSIRFDRQPGIVRTPLQPLYAQPECPIEALTNQTVQNSKTNRLSKQKWETF